MKFKTNINCKNCLAKVAPFLNEETSIQMWDVDIQVSDKILSVQTDEKRPEKVINAVKRAGFIIEEIKE